MKKMNVSKITVIGFVVFVISIYTGSYYYTKNNNERLLSSPRLVLLNGSEDTLNSELLSLSYELRRAKMRTLYELGMVHSVSQIEFDNGATDIVELNKDNNIGKIYSVVDCLDYSELLKKTMEITAKTTMKASWVFSACGIIE